MLKYLGILLMVVGLLVLLWGQWVAFEIYANQKLLKINQNTASFLHGVNAGESFINIPVPSESLFFIRDREGRMITTSNAIKPLRVEDYSAASYSRGGIQTFTYTKRFSLEEYTEVLLTRPFATGVFLSGLVFLLAGLFAFLRGQTGRVVSHKESNEEYQEILKRLRVLREVVALGGVLPRESLKEVKGIVEDIIRRMEGRI